MPTGTLQVRVTTSDGTLPVSEATVKISDALGHIVEILTETCVQSALTIVQKNYWKGEKIKGLTKRQ